MKKIVQNTLKYHEMSLEFQNFVMGMKQLRLRDFLPKARTKASLILNSDYEIKKQRTKI
jgi:hypothetical protein